MTASSAPHVVILGGGFAGLHAAKSLGHAPVRVTLVDRRNHHLYFRHNPGPFQRHDRYLLHQPNHSFQLNRHRYQFH